MTSKPTTQADDIVGHLAAAARELRCALDAAARCPSAVAAARVDGVLFAAQRVERLHTAVRDDIAFNARKRSYSGVRR